MKIKTYWRKDNNLGFMRKWVNFQSSVSPLQGYRGCRLYSQVVNFKQKTHSELFSEHVETFIRPATKLIEWIFLKINVFENLILIKIYVKKCMLKIAKKTKVSDPVTIWIKYLEWTKNEASHPIAQQLLMGYFHQC